MSKRFVANLENFQDIAAILLDGGKTVDELCEMLDAGYFDMCEVLKQIQSLMIFVPYKTSKERTLCDAIMLEDEWRLLDAEGIRMLVAYLWVLEMNGDCWKTQYFETKRKLTGIQQAVKEFA